MLYMCRISSRSPYLWFLKNKKNDNTEQSDSISIYTSIRSRYHIRLNWICIGLCGHCPLFCLTEFLRTPWSQFLRAHNYWMKLQSKLPMLQFTLSLQLLQHSKTFSPILKYCFYFSLKFRHFYNTLANNKTCQQSKFNMTSSIPTITDCIGLGIAPSTVFGELIKKNLPWV